MFSPGDRFPSDLGGGIVTRVGTGSTSLVYVVQADDGRRVAYKTCRDEHLQDHAVLGRLKYEAALTLLLEPHECVVESYSYDVLAGRGYLLMQAVGADDGPSNLQQLNRTLPASAQLMCMIGFGVIGALQHVYNQGCLGHFDLKPSNILLEVVDGMPIPVVGDWGSALMDLPQGDARRYRSANPYVSIRPTAATSKGWVTPAYASPELLRAGPLEVDGRLCDIYALGRCLIDMLLIRPAQGVRLKRNSLVKALQETSIYPGERSVFRDVAQLLLDMTATQPGKRLSDLDEAAQRLLQLMPGQPDWDWVKAGWDSRGSTSWGHRVLGLHKLGRDDLAGLLLEAAPISTVDNLEVFLDADGLRMLVPEKLSALLAERARATDASLEDMSAAVRGYIFGGQYDEARALLAELGSVVVSGPRKEGATWHASLLDEINQHEGATALRSGQYLVLEGRFELGLAELNRARELRQEDPEVWYHLGLVHYSLQAYGAAEECYREATRLQPTSSKAWNNLGLCLLAQDSQEEAVECFERAACDPGDAKSLYNLAQLALDDGEEERARELLLAAIRRDPGYRLAHSALQELSREADG